jgi:hypothetical protein
LVCHGQQSKVTWRKACIWNRIAQNSWHWHKFMPWCMLCTAGHFPTYCILLKGFLHSVDLLMPWLMQKC